MALPLTGNLVARDDEIHTRTLSSIVLTCLFTLLTCAWCCVRPDIPSPHDSKRRILITKLNIIFWVLVSPEMVAFWSFRQWFEAGRVAEEFKRKEHLYLSPSLLSYFQIGAGQDDTPFFFSWAASFCVTMVSRYRHSLSHCSGDCFKEVPLTFHPLQFQKSKSEEASILPSLPL